jgi:CheY-like chemotaxis protein
MATRERILLVDDHAPNLLALQAVLEPLGHELICCTSGEAALQHLLQGEVAAILLDVQLPGLSGFETAALIKQRERNRNVPILFLTASSREPAQAARGYGVGAVDYLCKPVEPEVLRAKVDALVALTAAERAQRLEAERLRAQRRADRARLLRHEHQARAAAEAERNRLRALLDHAPALAASFRGPAHELEFASEALRQAFPDRPLEGRPAREALPELAGQGLLERLESVRVGRQPHRGSVLRARLPGAEEERTFSLALQPLDGSPGEEGVLCFAFDVTEVHAARLQAEAALRLRDEFLGVASHELRTPLTPLSLRLQALERELAGPAVQPGRLGEHL